MVNAPDCGSGTRGFKSHQPPHDNMQLKEYLVYIGASPSGKATDSDSVIRRFESCYPSQSGDIAKW